MDTINIVSDGTPLGTEIKTASGYKIHGVRAMTIHVDVEGLAYVMLELVAPLFNVSAPLNKVYDPHKHPVLRNLLMSEHNRIEIERAGISRIH